MCCFVYSEYRFSGSVLLCFASRQTNRCVVGHTWPHSAHTRDMPVQLRNMYVCVWVGVYVPRHGAKLRCVYTRTPPNANKRRYRGSTETAVIATHSDSMPLASGPWTEREGAAVGAAGAGRAERRGREQWGDCGDGDERSIMIFAERGTGSRAFNERCKHLTLRANLLSV